MENSFKHNTKILLVIAIRKKYAGRTDKVTQQKLNEEIMALYQKENFNPAGGCLPMLIQLPVLMALYQVIINPLKYICMFSAETITAITDKLTELGAAATNYQIAMINNMRSYGLENFEGLTEELHNVGDILPNFMFLNKIDLSLTPDIRTFNIILLIPFITFVVSYFSMKLTKKFTYQPTQADGTAVPNSKILDFSFPAMSLWIAFMVPAVIGIYWIFQNVLSFVQQVILSKIYPIPTFTEEELKAAEKEYGKTKRNEPKKKVRSLHRIDEEDDEPSEQAEVPKENKEKPLIERAKLKEEEKKESEETEEDVSSDEE